MRKSKNLRGEILRISALFFFLSLTVACLSLRLDAGQVSPHVSAAKVQTLSGAKISPLEEMKSRATVLFFISSDCPIANSYAPDILSLQKEYVPKNIAFYVVYVGTSLAAAQKHAKAYHYTNFPAIIDSKQVLVKRVKASVTPETFVIAPDGKTLYQGRIDDRYKDFGKSQHVATVYDLRAALDALLENKPVATPKTKAVGCFITLLK